MTGKRLLRAVQDWRLAWWRRPAAGAVLSYKPIRFVVGFSRAVVSMCRRGPSAAPGAALGQSVVVDNKPGAAGNIAAAFVAKATPDGYTLLMSNSTIAVPGLFKSLPFDIRKDLEPVALIAIGPSVLVVHLALPATNVKELVALARAKPGQLTYGSGGIGNVYPPGDGALETRWSASRWSTCRTRAPPLPSSV